MTREGSALQQERTNIDRINAELLTLLAERFCCVLRLAEIKRELGRPGVDPSRETEMLQKLESQWCRLPIADKIPWARVAPVYREIFKNSAAVQSRISPED
jgi:chorismate mutase